MTDARVYDFTIYDDTGSVLVAMTGLELKRNLVSSLPGVERRYEIVLQPVVTSPVLPRTTQWSRLDKETVNSIGPSPTTRFNSSSASRLIVFRPLAVISADNVIINLQRSLPPLPSPSVADEIKMKWPIHFQIIERLSRIHHEVFETTTVSTPELCCHGVFLTVGANSGN
jgi:hypothetical protein